MLVAVNSMIPLSTEFAIREAIKLLADSRRNFRSRQVEQARRLLEKLIDAEGRSHWPPQKA